jgi:GTP-binding protein HflX
LENSTLVDFSKATKGAIIVGVHLESEKEEYTVIQDLNELESLLKTLGIKTLGREIQKRQKLTASHLIGTGKIEEISHQAEDLDAGIIVFDYELSGPQIRNIEKETSCQVLDRAGVILDIFARHAKTNEARTQVEIAQLEYLLPRLTGAWTHFGRQSGGGVKSKGMGEKQIEIDRRRAREKIAKLQKKLIHIEKEKATQRKSRQNEIKVAIVGYTNSGKTTVMKTLTRASIDGKDELFATLDSSIRTIDPNTRPKILLSDTVGFIRNLPHGLIESFKSTLAEVLDANLLLHVVDISHSNYKAQMETTDQVLQEIGAEEVESLIVFNKMDQVDDPFLPKILSKKYPGSISISAHSMSDIKRLRDHIFQHFQEQFKEEILVVKSDDQEVLSQVYQNCVILDADYETEGEVHFKVKAPKYTVEKILKLLGIAPEKEEF